MSARDDAKFERIERERRHRDGLDLFEPDGRLRRSKTRLRQDAFSEPSREGFIGGIFRKGIKGVADKAVRILRRTDESSEHLEFGERGEQRINHWLNRHVGAVGGATIGPAFEIV